MKQRAQDLVAVGDNLFSKRHPIMSRWQVEAENFHVMRADFTRQRYMSEEFGSYMMTGRPARCHRDLSNAFSAMLRRDQWFHAKTDSELVNNDRDAKMWLDWASKTQRLMMYDRRANFVRATKEADGDFCAFGNAVIMRDVCEYEHLLYDCHHLRDVAWDEDYKRHINTVHFNWKPQARQLKQLAKKNGNFKLSPEIEKLTSKEAFKEFTCRRIIVPADEYDLDPKIQRGMPWVSIRVDVENQFVMEEVPLRTKPFTIPRFAFGGTMYGSQYGFSPPVVYGLPDARMMQNLMLSMLVASEKATNPPMVAVGEAINGAVNLFPDGITQTDADYDERTGEVLRPITLQLEGIRYGAEQMQAIGEALSDAFYLSKIRFPEIKKEMTAFESSKLWDDFIRESTPLFEPVETDYNADICDGTFEDLLGLGKFGAIDDMPQILRGRDISWQFDTPLKVAAEKALTASFQVMIQTISEGMQIDPTIRLNFDIDEASRDAVDGAGAPAKWTLPKERVAKLKAAEQQQKQAEQQANAIAHGADTATRVGTAAKSAGDAAKSLQDAGLAG